MNEQPTPQPPTAPQGDTAQPPKTDLAAVLATYGVNDAPLLDPETIQARVKDFYYNKFNNDREFRRPFEQKAFSMAAEAIKEKMFDGQEGRELNSFEEVIAAVRNKYHGADEQGRKALDMLNRVEAERDAMRGKIEALTKQHAQELANFRILSEVKLSLASSNLGANIGEKFDPMFFAKSFADRLASEYNIVVEGDDVFVYGKMSEKPILNPKTGRMITIKELITQMADGLGLLPTASKESFTHPGRGQQSASPAPKTQNDADREYWARYSRR